MQEIIQDTVLAQIWRKNNLTVEEELIFSEHESFLHTKSNFFVSVDNS